MIVDQLVNLKTGKKVLNQIVIEQEKLNKIHLYSYTSLICSINKTLNQMKKQYLIS